MECCRSSCKNRSDDPKRDGWAYIEFDPGPPKNRMVLSRLHGEPTATYGGHGQRSHHRTPALTMSVTLAGRRLTIADLRAKAAPPPEAAPQTCLPAGQGSPSDGASGLTHPDTLPVAASARRSASSRGSLGLCRQRR